jgi:hypothetical protein
MTRFETAQSLIDLDGAQINFQRRPYLKDIYNCTSNFKVLRFSRQTEKSTTLAIMIALTALLDPKARILIVLPRNDQLKVFRETRLMPILRSALIAPLLLGKDSDFSAKFIRCSSGAHIYLQSAFNTADSCRGISANYLILDEYQDLAHDALPVLMATMSHAENSSVILAGTPKSADNPLEVAFNLSTQCAWETKCEACGLSNGPEEKTIGPDRLICAGCGHPLDFLKGAWISKNPGAKSSGYWLNFLVTPWYRHDALLTYQKDFTRIQFKNEYLGLPSQLGDQLVTQAETEACCSSDRMCKTRNDMTVLGINRNTLVLGIDWGGGSQSRTAFVLGAHDSDSNFRVLLMECMPIDEDPEPALNRAAEIIQLMSVRFVAADGCVSGAMLNRQFLLKIKNSNVNLFGIAYVNHEQKPQTHASLVKWSIDRSASIADVFTRIKTKKILFPALGECQNLLPEIWRQTAEYDPKLRRVSYMCPPGSTDDILHALTYGMRVSTKLRSSVADM